jgi:hypothetical protein
MVLLLVAALPLVACESSQSVQTRSNAATKGCVPAPCAIVGGFKLTVTSLNRNVSGGIYLKPEAGDHYVTIQLAFANGSNQTRSIAQSDFTLRDASARVHGVAFAPIDGCEMWQPVDQGTGRSVPVKVSPGSTSGPKDLCFQASGPPEGPVVLLWSSAFLPSRIEIPAA